jgi:hypothetical protein
MSRHFSSPARGPGSPCPPLEFNICHTAGQQPKRRNTRAIRYSTSPSRCAWLLRERRPCQSALAPAVHVGQAERVNYPLRVSARVARLVLQEEAAAVVHEGRHAAREACVSCTHAQPMRPRRNMGIDPMWCFMRIHPVFSVYHFAASSNGSGYR